MKKIIIPMVIVLTIVTGFTVLLKYDDKSGEQKQNIEKDTTRVPHKAKVGGLKEMGVKIPADFHNKLKDAKEDRIQRKVKSNQLPKSTKMSDGKEYTFADFKATPGFIRSYRQDSQLFDPSTSPYTKAWKKYNYRTCHTCRRQKMFNVWPSNNFLSNLEPDLLKKAENFIQNTISEQYVSQEAYENIRNLDRADYFSTDSSLIWGSQWNVSGRKFQIISDGSYSTLIITHNSVDKDDIDALFSKGMRHNPDGSAKKGKELNQAISISRRVEEYGQKIFNQVITLYAPYYKEKARQFINGSAKGGLEYNYLGGRLIPNSLDKNKICVKERSLELDYWITNEVVAFHLKNELGVNCN